jgi:hypothetical protein
VRTATFASLCPAETARQVSGHLFRSVHIFAAGPQTAHQERRIDGYLLADACKTCIEEKEAHGHCKLE